MKKGIGNNKPDKDSSKEVKTPEEVFSVSDAEILSNWTSFASFIKNIEGAKWEDAKRTALKLLEEDKAAEFVSNHRKKYKGETSISESTTQAPVIKDEPPAKHRTTKSEPNTIQPYSGNYKRLMRIAPGLEERLLSGEEVYGKSIVAGYMDVSLELLEKDRHGKYHLAIAHNYVQEGDLIPDPDMRILVDVENQTVEALTFQNSMYYMTVYEDPYNRDKVSLSQKRNQNSFLTTWLRNLIKQGHQIMWRESDNQSFPFESEIEIDQPEDEIKQENMKESDNKPTIDDVEETVKHWKKLASAIRQAEGISQEKADAKAQKLKQQGKAESYLMKLLSSKSQDNVQELLKANYKRLIRLIPDINQRSRKGSVDGVLEVPASNSYLVYDLVPATGPKQAGWFFGINETNFNQNVENGSLILSIHPSKHTVQVMVTINGFHFTSDYDSSDFELSDRETYKANKQLADWLDQAISLGYQAQWNDTPIDTGKEPELEEPAETQKEEAMEKEKKKKPDPLRPQKIGKVKLKPQHINAGLTQADIDWINKHKQGMVITPRKNAVNNTKSLEMDMELNARRPGFRISATGMLYYEGRSNRSDLTDHGL